MKKTLSVLLALAICLGLTVPATAATPVTLSEEGASITLNDVISYEDVPVWYPDDGEGDPCATVERIYHFPSEASFIVQNGYQDPDNEGKVGLSYWASYTAGGHEIDGKPVLCPKMNDLYSFGDDDIIWGYINLRENLNKISEDDKELYEGESSGIISPTLPIETGMLVRLYVDLSTSSTTPGVGGGGSYPVISIYCAFDDGKFSFSDSIGKTSTTPANPSETSTGSIPASGTAKASTQTVTVDGKSMEFQMYALLDANGNSTNYIKLRDMAYVLNGTKAQFAVGYNGKIALTTGEPYVASGAEMKTPFSGDQAYTGGIQSVQVNGKPVDMTAITLHDNQGGGYNYFNLRDLGKALGFNVGYSNEQGVFIESDKSYVG